ncbi:hypothetical protein BKA63DRAFT_522101 [Paraphoma chrysanthemicola]|nr:hypothetical protein BKA63DRAFT_522101 [Paraphoma chrysanthemicola]
MSTAAHHPSASPFHDTNMASRAQYDEFAIKYYDQGSPLPLQHPLPTHQLSPACPYHMAILDTRTPRPTQGLARSIPAPHQELLERMPPVGLTDKWQVGTSASCGCTCALSLSLSTNNFARDVDAVVHNTSSVVSRTAHAGTP